MAHLRGGKDDKRTARLGLVDLYSKLVVGATGAVSSQTGEGLSGFVITRAAAGRYRLTFTEKWNDMVYANFVVDSQGTVVDASCQVFTGYTATNGYVDLSHVVAGSELDPVSGNELLIHVCMKSKDVG
jgi:hypothetical protein